MSVYQCEHCQFITMNKSDYNKHIHTMKHLSRIPETEPMNVAPVVGEHVKDTKLFLCSHCNKAYKSKNGLHYHSKKCVCGAIVDISNEIIPMDISFLEIHEPVLSGKVGHSCENTKIVGRITASFDDIPITRNSSTNSIVDASTTLPASLRSCHILKDDIGVLQNMRGHPPLRYGYQTRSVAKLPAELVVEGFQPSDHIHQPKEEDDCEYVDESYHMGVILDLLPEANENMTEFILYAGSAAVVGVFAYVVFVYLFHYVPV